jgi:DNA polymerase delta subunit 1
MEFQILQVEPLYSVSGKYSLIQVFGRTEDGRSVSALVRDVQSYFYIESDTPESLVDALNKKLLSQLSYATCRRHGCDRVRCPNRTARGHIYRPQVPCFEPCMAHQDPEGDPITLGGTVQRRPLIGWGAPRTFHRVNVAQPYWLPHCKRIMHKWGHTASEAHIDHVTRFMADRGLVGCGWARVGKLEEPPEDYECNSDIVGVTDTIEPVDRDDCAPLRVLAFDIECISPSGEFPEPSKPEDQVIQISAVLLRFGAEAQEKHMFVLDGCDGIEGAHIHAFTDEADLLSAWRDFILDKDPDIMSGYNSNQFDLPYLFRRAVMLGLGDFAFQGKVRRRHVQYKTVFNSAQTGAQAWDRHLIAGRVCMDVHELIRKGKNLRSYKLNDISEQVLGDKKEDVSYREILPLHRGSSADRAKLAKYCLQDSVLVMNLILKLMLITNNVELARVTGIQLSQVWEKGQTFRVESQVLRFGMDKYLIPTFRKDYDEGRTVVDAYDGMHLELNRRMGHPERGSEPPEFIGATVIEPDAGFYAESPIATLDFASLYPSIMMRHNLSFDTLVFTEDHARESGLSPGDYAQSPNGYLFVRREKQKGILPRILEQLLSRRKLAKRAMAEATDPFLRGIMNGRQLALKVCANSVYGYCGSPTCAIPCQGISTSVTAYGREMIFNSKKFVEDRHPDCKVIYGDTDSIMIKFPPGTAVATAIERAKGMEAQFVEEKFFAKPIFLEYEKVFFPFLLLKKKKYVALKYEEDPTRGKIDAKGIEMVRRDNCLLVSKTQTTLIDILMK